MVDSYVGEIRLWTYSRIPSGWAACDGSKLSISEYQPLYALIGTTWGGDGATTFALPDFRDRLVMGQGAGIGLTPRALSQTGGSTTVALTADQMPAHTHVWRNVNVPAASAAPVAGGAPANLAAPAVAYTTQANLAAPLVQFNSGAVAAAGGAGGGAVAHANTMPSIALMYIISLNGLYPMHA